MDAITRLKSGHFNNRSSETQPDGSVIVTFSMRGEGKVYRLQVRDLYGPNEEVLWEDIKEVS